MRNSDEHSRGRAFNRTQLCSLCLAPLYTCDASPALTLAHAQRRPASSLPRSPQISPDLPRSPHTAGPPRELTALHVVPARPGRLLRFRGDQLHAVPAPAGEWLGEAEETATRRAADTADDSRCGEPQTRVFNPPTLEETRCSEDTARGRIHSCMRCARSRVSSRGAPITRGRIRALTLAHSRRRLTPPRRGSPRPNSCGG